MQWNLQTVWNSSSEKCKYIKPNYDHSNAISHFSTDHFNKNTNTNSLLTTFFHILIHKFSPFWLYHRISGLPHGNATEFRCSLMQSTWALDTLLFRGGGDFWGARRWTRAWRDKRPTSVQIRNLTFIHFQFKREQWTKDLELLTRLLSQHLSRPPKLYRVELFSPLCPFDMYVIGTAEGQERAVVLVNILPRTWTLSTGTAIFRYQCREEFKNISVQP